MSVEYKKDSGAGFNEYQIKHIEAIQSFVKSKLDGTEVPVCYKPYEEKIAAAQASVRVIAAPEYYTEIERIRIKDAKFDPAIYWHIGHFSRTSEGEVLKKRLSAQGKVFDVGQHARYAYVNRFCVQTAEGVPGWQSDKSYNFMHAVAANLSESIRIGSREYSDFRDEKGKLKQPEYKQECIKSAELILRAAKEIKQTDIYTTGFGEGEYLSGLSKEDAEAARKLRKESWASEAKKFGITVHYCVWEKEKEPKTTCEQLEKSYGNSHLKFFVGDLIKIAQDLPPEKSTTSTFLIPGSSVTMGGRYPTAQRTAEEQLVREFCILEVFEATCNPSLKEKLDVAILAAPPQPEQLPTTLDPSPHPEQKEITSPVSFFYQHRKPLLAVALPSAVYGVSVGTAALIGYLLKENPEKYLAITVPELGDLTTLELAAIAAATIILFAMIAVLLIRPKAQLDNPIADSKKP